MRPLADEASISRALVWITAQFRTHEIPYQVVGGLAARAYGGSRPVVDLDFYAPIGGASGFLDAIADHTVTPLEDFRNDSWDLALVRIDHGPVRIEIVDTNSAPKYFDRLRGEWVDQGIDFSRSEIVRAFGVDLCVIPLADLLAYKAALNREVDLLDIAELTSQRGNLSEGDSTDGPGDAVGR